MNWDNIFIGIGSNMGNRKDNCNQGINALKKIKEINIIQCSSFYKTEPVGGPKQNWFINCVVKAETSLLPEKLLSCLKKLEVKMGRVQSVKWGARIIDFDILFFGDKIVETPSLKIPHPLNHKRRFVLEPMGEIAPDVVHPVFKKSINELKMNPECMNQKVGFYE